MILKIRQYSDGEFGRIIEDRIFENPKNLAIQSDRTYNKDLAEKIGVNALFPLKEKECRCNFIFFYVNDIYHSYACWPDSIFLMSDSGKTIDKY